MQTIQRDVVGAFMFSSDQCLLLGKGGVYADTWIVPGGGVDAGETFEDALRREIDEETHINLTNATIRQLQFTLTGESPKLLRETGEQVLAQMRFYNFIVQLPEPSHSIRMQCDDDFMAAQWFSLSQLKSLPLSPPTIATLTNLGYL